MVMVYHEYNDEFDVYPRWHKQTPDVSYMVCTTPRSGSSLLCLTLMEAGRMGVPAEYLDKTNKQNLRYSWNVLDGKSYIRELIARRTSASGVFGMKLHWHNLVNFYNDNIWSIHSSKSDNVFTSLDNMLGHYLGEVKYIFLTRNDKAGQAVSYWLATQTGQWRRYKGEDLPPVEHIEYDYNGIERMFTNLLEQENKWKIFFESNNIDPLMVEYEYMIARFDECINAVTNYISGHAMEIEMFSGIERQSYEESDKLIEKFTADLGQASSTPGLRM